jgi:hypothetical protein
MQLDFTMKRPMKNIMIRKNPLPVTVELASSQAIGLLPTSLSIQVYSINSAVFKRNLPIEVFFIPPADQQFAKLRLDGFHVHVRKQLAPLARFAAAQVSVV